jgi:hypothetical protein
VILKKIYAVPGMVNPLVTDPCSLRCPYSLENLIRGLKP